METLPSTCTSDYWIWAENLSDQNFMPPTVKCGKWMIFKTYDQIDDVWAIIKKATEEGLLGFRSKVATIKDKDCNSSERGVICIYTYDYTDEGDVMRVRKALRELGFDHNLPYKADEDTNAGKYRSTGYKRIKYVMNVFQRNAGEDSSDSEDFVRTQFSFNPVVSENGDGLTPSLEKILPKPPLPAEFNHRETSSNPFLNYFENGAGQDMEPRRRFELSRPSAGDDFRLHQQNDVSYQLKEIRNQEEEISKLRKELDGLRTVIDTATIDSNRNQCSKLKCEVGRLKDILQASEKDKSDQRDSQPSTSAQAENSASRTTTLEFSIVKSSPTTSELVKQSLIPDFDKIVAMVTKMNRIIRSVEKVKSRLLSSGNKHGLEQEVKTLVITLFKNGWFLGDCERFLPFATLSGRQFVQDIYDGYFPSELTDRHPNGIELSIRDNRTELYKVEPNVFPDFDRTIHMIAELNARVEKNQKFLNASEVIREPVTISMYQNGVVLDSKYWASFRTFSNLSLVCALEDIYNGYFPGELTTHYPNGVPIMVNDRRNVAYVNEEDSVSVFRRISGYTILQAEPCRNFSQQAQKLDNRVFEQLKERENEIILLKVELAESVSRSTEKHKKLKIEMERLEQRLNRRSRCLVQ